MEILYFPNKENLDIKEKAQKEKLERGQVNAGTNFSRVRKR